MNYTIILAAVFAIIAGLMAYWNYEGSDDMLKSIGAPVLSAIGVLLFVGLIGTSLGAGIFPGMGAVPRVQGEGAQDITVQEPQTTSFAGVTVLDGLQEDTEITDPDTVMFSSQVPEMGATFEARQSLDNYSSGSAVEIGATPGKSLYVLVEESGYYSEYTDLRTGSDQFSATIPEVNLDKIGSTNLSITDASIADGDYNLSTNTLQIDNEVTDFTLTLHIGIANPYTALQDVYMKANRGGSWDNVGTLVQDPTLPDGLSVETSTGDFNLEDEDEGELFTDGSYSWPNKISINIQATSLDTINSGTLWTIDLDDLDGDYGYNMQTGISEETITVEKTTLD